MASLDLTHVLYDDSSYLSLALALLTLSPIFLMAAYAALAVQTRELTIIIMWAGQVLCEGFNWVLKHIIKQERPVHLVGNGFGFPSSHSQYMGFFASFLICHIYFRHRFTSCGSKLLDQLWRILLYIGLATWAGAVAYSRYHLTYHTPHQIFWGLGIGVFLGVSLYLIAELIPARQPTSLPGLIRAFLVENPISTWLQLRDGWAIWADGGREEEWNRWRKKWQERKALASTKRTS